MSGGRPFLGVDVNFSAEGDMCNSTGTSPKQGWVEDIIVLLNRNLQAINYYTLHSIYQNNTNHIIINNIHRIIHIYCRLQHLQHAYHANLVQELQQRATQHSQI